MLKIALINLGDGRKYSQIDEGLGLESAGLAFIAGHLEKHGFTVTVIDQNMLGLSMEEVAEKISDAKMVGFNPLANTRESFVDIIDRVRRCNPDIVTVIGGYDATFRRLADYGHQVDVLVRGCGEVAMVELAQRLHDGRTFADIKGVAYRDRDGKINETRSIKERADSPPTDIQPARQNLQYLKQNNEPVSIVASVGCGWGCWFCSTTCMYGESRRQKPIEKVLEEIDFLTGHGVKKLSFWDEDFFGHSIESLSRADQIIAHARKCGATITFSFITPAGMSAAKKFNYYPKWEGAVERIYVGIEGGCTHALKALGKKGTTAQLNERVVNEIREYNIGLQIGFMMFNPYSDYQELRDSAHFLSRTNEAANMVSFCHRLRPYPGTPIYEPLLQTGLLIEAEARRQVDVHTSIPYRFKSDVESGTNIKRLAETLGSLESHKFISESDRLNNEIYMSLVRAGYSKDIFSEEQGNPVAKAYKEVRVAISSLNLNLFLDTLKLFEGKQGGQFDDLKELYLISLKNLLDQMRELKRQMGSLQSNSLPVDSQ